MVKNYIPQARGNIMKGIEVIESKIGNMNTFDIDVTGDKAMTKVLLKIENRVSKENYLQKQAIMDAKKEAAEKAAKKKVIEEEMDNVRPVDKQTMLQREKMKKEHDAIMEALKKSEDRNDCKIVLNTV